MFRIWCLEQQSDTLSTQPTDRIQNYLWRGHKKIFERRRRPLINLWGANWNTENVLKHGVGTTLMPNRKLILLYG